jgi:hypothetical protein
MSVILLTSSVLTDILVHKEPHVLQFFEECVQVHLTPFLFSTIMLLVVLDCTGTSGLKQYKSLSLIDCGIVTDDLAEDQSLETRCVSAIRGFFLFLLLLPRME